MQPDEIQKVVPVTSTAPKKEAGNKIKKVVRFLGGKRVIKRKCTGFGYYYDPKQKRCVKMSPKEIHNRFLGSKKRIRKMRAKMGIILRKRAKSMKIRQARMG